MKPRKLRIGLIGAGGIVRGAHLAPGWNSIAEAEIVAVADVHPDTAKALARDFHIPNIYTDFRDLLKHGEIDAVDICTPNRVHTPAVLASLAAGKHVLCEKPLATTVAEVRQMQRAAKRAKRVLMTAQHQRFGELAVACKRWIDAGNLGKVYHSRIHATRRNLLPPRPGFIDPKLSGGGPCMDIGVHALDLGMWFMDFPRPVRVTGTARVNFAKGHTIPGAWGEWDRKLFGVEDFAAGFVHFEDGSTMTLEASWLQHQHENEDMSCRLFGMKAGLEWPSGRFSTTANRALIDGTIHRQPDLPKPHTGEIMAFFDAVTQGKPSPVPVEQTIFVIGILEAIMSSSASKREERVKL